MNINSYIVENTLTNGRLTSMQQQDESFRIDFTCDQSNFNFEFCNYITMESDKHLLIAKQGEEFYAEFSKGKLVNVAKNTEINKLERITPTMSDKWKIKKASLGRDILGEEYFYYQGWLKELTFDVINTYWDKILYFKPKEFKVVEDILYLKDIHGNLINFEYIKNFVLPF